MTLQAEPSTTPKPAQDPLAAALAPAASSRQRSIDALSTLVTDGTMLKVYAWYDNEMGYACRMVDLACHLQRQGL